MSARLDPSWSVLASPSTRAVDRCVDVFQRPDGTFGFEEFRRDPEDWLRAVLEDGPRPIRAFVLVGWIGALRLRLGPRPAPGYVAGWRILSATPVYVTIGIESPFLRAHQVFRLHGQSFVHVTFVRFEGRLGRVLWGVAAPIHVRVIPYLMAHAARARR